MPDLSFFSFLASPIFVVLWYIIGLIAAIWVVQDEYLKNTQVQPALKWAWPIIVVFFSVIGLALYLWTCRPPGIENKTGKQEKQAHHEYVSSTFRKVTGSVIHCVGGDGLGIITAMVVARLIGMNFWQEYWFEYVVGFAFGWFIFQYKAMRKMADSPMQALWMGGRAEFFSMITVMSGMGVVMGYVTPLTVGEQPHPATFAFWGFAALGLLMGFIVTYPMNYWLVKIGWKHGMS
ncbi:glyceraldehyde-3-phosphate dehydrogenase [Novimethylophilus kurashikiensis]|uniref:Glyceraldehyde-3-phosphate dehydrogenase n=1 Tax=Novimethylophilus kurashikiensis TaxID=1825523 RepID=A0A2R5FC58_9PROT|nr:DUF4396 domain-containing protein [Novimethylophilus kurashikiensis]GBG14224.1 glyceraldehyde-3-phosphate dehydrogenase [Novimethylophilus kurashikiensis]